MVGRRVASHLIGSVLVISAVLAASVWAPPVEASSSLALSPERPSIVVIVTDDQRWDTLWAMPKVRSKLAGHGIKFREAFVSNSLCCPSRASILTGDYSHTTGVWANSPPNGGLASFDDSTTLATILHDDGYRTGLFGKYLNGYRDVPHYVPPGWDRWFAFTRLGFYDYGISAGGRRRSFGSRARHYSTDLLAAKAEDFVRRTEGPLFLYLAPYAPHRPSTPGPGHERAFADLAPARPPSFNEADVEDKPTWLRERPPVPPRRVERRDRLRIDGFRTLLSVDDAVARIVSALRDTGRLDNTLIVFMSDNGYLHGEHRWTSKGVPYEESIRIPMVIRFDPLAAGPIVEDRIALNIDLAPTIVAVTGSPAPSMDGASLVPLLTQRSGVRWRDDFLLEHLAKPGDRVPSFCGIRTVRATYAYYETGEEELYRLERDPYQLDNVAKGTDKSALRARTAKLCSPPPPGLKIPSGW